MPPTSRTVCATVGAADHRGAVTALGLHPEHLLDLDGLDPTSLVAAESESAQASASAVVSAATLADLRRVLPALALLGSATRVVVLVLDRGGDRMGVPGVVVPGVGVVQAGVAALPSAAGWRVDVRHTGPVPVAAVVRAVVRGAGPAGWRAALGLRVGVAASELTAWVPADPLALAVGPAAAEGAAPVAVDVVLAPVGTPERPGVPTVQLPAPPVWEELAAAGRARLRQALDVDHRVVPPVDEGVLNPVGFRAFGCAGSAELVGAGDRPGWVVRRDGRELLRLHADGRITDADVRALRDLVAVHIRWEGSAGPVSAVRSVVQLAAAGVPLVSGRVPAWAAPLLGRDLVQALTRPVPEVEQQDHELRREEHSVRLRRAALTTHSCEARWRQLVEGLPVRPAPPPAVSVVVATRRPDMLRFAVEQVRRQTGVAVQLVLALHGFPRRSPEVEAAVRDLPFPFEVVERPQQEVFGDVLNAGVSRCDGAAVAKMDDDDWYGPHHLADMVLAQRYSGSEVTGSAADFVYLQPLHLTVRRRFPSEVPAEYVAGGTLVVDRSALAAVGGFRRVPRDVDAHLLRDLRAVGGRVYRTHALGFVLRRTAGGHTWDADLTYFLRGRGEQWRGFRPSVDLQVEDRHVPVRATVEEAS